MAIADDFEIGENTIYFTGSDNSPDYTLNELYTFMVNIDKVLRWELRGTTLHAIWEEE